MGGIISGVDLREKLTGNLQLDNVKTLAATDGLRLSYMLNQLDGHHIPKDNSQGAFIGRDKKVYIYDLPALKTYLTKTYGDPLTASSVSEVTGQRGILMLDASQTDRSAGSVGLWDCNNMHQIKDYTKASSVRSVTLWKTNGKWILQVYDNMNYVKQHCLFIYFRIATASPCVAYSGFIFS